MKRAWQHTPTLLPLYSPAFEGTAGLEPFNPGTRIRRVLAGDPASMYRSGFSARARLVFAEQEGECNQSDR
jgi:hypothetical protein